MPNLKGIKTFIADIEARDPQGRTITQQDFADVLQSLSKVAGTMSLSTTVSGTQLVAGWNRLDMWDKSKDTQGVKDGLSDPTDPGGYYTINSAAQGDYTCCASIRFSADISGVYRMRIAQIDGTSTFASSSDEDAINATAGDTVQLVIASALIKNVVDGDRLQVEFRGPNGATVTGYYGHFGVQR